MFKPGGTGSCDSGTPGRDSLADIPDCRDTASCTHNGNRARDTGSDGCVSGAGEVHRPHDGEKAFKLSNTGCLVLLWMSMVSESIRVGI